ncbi:hypothetical protein BpHYR1_037181 [Brachionus plicatilis]|uniref:Uncharacterized protein n=1 Tax=Brachionus plicatilis TaxID=10195 RepID=A0A3M7P915_BRAPC|nr:hypothetical protein BpHYR1_037181 [Brachionus plicatilis]
MHPIDIYNTFFLTVWLLSKITFFYCLIISRINSKNNRCQKFELNNSLIMINKFNLNGDFNSQRWNY